MRITRARTRDERGFNLIELMIVIAIIGLLIAVGGIGWSAMIKSGNETAAAQTLDRLKTYQAQYAAKHKGNFGNFEKLIEMGVVDESFRGDAPVVNGYVFTMTVTDSSGSAPAFYSINADPQVSQGITATGGVHYYTDSAIGTIKRTDENRQAKQDDQAL